MIPETSSMDRPVERKTARRLALPIAILAAAAVVAAFVLPGFGRWLGSERSIDRSRVRLGEVERTDLERDLAVQGRVVAAFHPTLFSPARGVVRLVARAGEQVARGAVLARLDSPELASRLKQEESTLAALAADLERQRVLAEQAELENRQEVELLEVKLQAAERAMERAERTRAEGLLNAVEYEEAQDELTIAALELANARRHAELDAATREFEIHDRESRRERQRLVVEELRRQVAELEIRSPVDGLVSRVDVEDHDAVVAGAPVVGVVDLSELAVEAMVPEAYADELVAGLAAEVTHEGRVWPAAVENVAPEVERSQVRTTLAFTGEAPPGLRQSQRLPVRLILEQRTDVLTVPRGPFLEAGAGRLAYVVGDDGVARPRAIETGAVSVERVEILAGLEIGESIIVSDVGRFEGADSVLLRD